MSQYGRRLGGYASGEFPITRLYRVANGWEDGDVVGGPLFWTKDDVLELGAVRNLRKGLAFCRKNVSHSVVSVSGSRSQGVKE